MGDLFEGWEGKYGLNDPKKGVIEGEVTIDGQKLSRCDGLGVSETESISITANDLSKLLIMEVPIQ